MTMGPFKYEPFAPIPAHHFMKYRISCLLWFFTGVNISPNSWILLQWNGCVWDFHFSIIIFLNIDGFKVFKRSTKSSAWCCWFAPAFRYKNSSFGMPLYKCPRQVLVDCIRFLKVYLWFCVLCLTQKPPFVSTKTRYGLLKFFLKICWETNIYFIFYQSSATFLFSKSL